MSKKIIVGFALILVLVLTACGTNSGEEVNLPDEASGGEGLQETPAAEGERGWFRQNNDAGELPPATRLAVGMILLEESEFALDLDQVEVLVPYWKLYLNLLESDATAPEELEALISQIQQILTPEQDEYITELDLVQENLMVLMSDLGLTEGLRPDGEEGGTGLNRPEGMEGMQPGGGMGRGQGGLEDMDPELMATMQARREEMGGSAGMRGAAMTQIPLIEALIELLEGKLEL